MNDEYHGILAAADVGEKLTFPCGCEIQRLTDTEIDDYLAEEYSVLSMGDLAGAMLFEALFGGLGGDDDASMN